ncbi:MAG: hypothetical protein U0794_20300 [Isosphaeraceae bacterium]
MMSDGKRRSRGAGWGAMTGAILAAAQAGSPEAQAQIAAPAPTVAQAALAVTPENLVRFDAGQLEAIYRNAGPGRLPRGRVRGIPIVAPGRSFGPAASRAGRLVWQGKVFGDDGTSAVNRFFGVRAVRGRLYQGTSWLDGQPSLVLDYQGTSLVYGRYRDEIREVAPGLYLGLMYTRSEPQPTLTRYFAFRAD